MVSLGFGLAPHTAQAKLSIYSSGLLNMVEQVSH